MSKHCGNCAVYDRKNMKHSELCGKCVIERYPNGKESDPSMWKPLPSQTNADRIRTMSDEELAEKIPCPYMVDPYDECKFGWHERTQTCKECTLEWLQKPTKDGEDK